MKLRYMVLILCIYSTTLLFAKESTPSDILQKVGEKNTFIHPNTTEKQSTKESHFIFKDTYDTNGIGLKHHKRVENAEKSKSYKYENKSRFKFKFTPGKDGSNLAARQGSSFGTAGGVARMGGGQGRGGHK